MESGMWAQLLCPIVYVMVFFFWQDIRAALKLGPATVFLDKYCIDQMEAEKKAKGILGIGAFLFKTERLVICWTPRYFTRLWCAYEMATWLYLRKPLDAVLFMPLATYTAIVFLGVALWIGTAVYHFSSPLTSSADILRVVLSLCANFFFFVHVLRHTVRDLRELPKQIKEFSVTKASCFCCTVGHKMPGSDDDIPCDRKLIYRTLEHWFSAEERGSKASGPDREQCHGLQRFDRQIKSLFGKVILLGSGPTRLKYQHTLISVQAYLWRTLDICVALGTVDTFAHLLTVVSYAFMTLCVLPASLKLNFHLVALLDRCIDIRTERYKDLMVSLCCTLAAFCLSVISWWTVLEGPRYESSLIRATVCVVWFFWILVALFLFRENLHDASNSGIKAPAEPSLASPRPHEDGKSVQARAGADAERSSEGSSESVLRI